MELVSEETKVMFVGKFGGTGGRSAFVRLGRELGYFTASEGFSLVVGSDSPSTLDAMALEGAAAFARETGTRVRWYVYEPADDKRRFVDVPDGLPPPHRMTLPSGPEGRWQIAHTQAARDSDAIIGLGGSTNTRRALRVAEEANRSVWVLPDFGGAAKERYSALTGNSARDKKHAKRLRSLAEGDKSDPGRRAHALIRGIGRTRRPAKYQAPRRVYFLSYSRKDNNEANHVELLLRRKNRGVLRDEVIFSTGRNLDDEIKAAIAAADDFLVVDSDNAAQSADVTTEIQIAYALEQAGLSPERVMGVLLHGHPPKTALKPRTLHQDGSTAPLRQIAVDKIVDSEPRQRRRKRRP
jgi:hypothetical protein